MTYEQGDARLKAALAVKARYEAGDTIRELRAQTGRSHGNILQLLALAGATMRARGRRSKFTDKQRREIAQRLADGEPSRTLAQEYGATVNHINHQRHHPTT